MDIEVTDSTQVAVNTCVTTRPMNNSFQKQSVEVLNVDNNQEDELLKELVWIRFGKLSHTRFQTDEIEVGHRLKDYHITFAQAIIKNQFSIKGLQCTLACFKRSTKLLTTNCKLYTPEEIIGLWHVSFSQQLGL